MLPPSSTLEPVETLARAGRLEEAFRKLQALAQDGAPDALVLLADYCWRGEPVEHDPVRARDLYRRAAEAGDPRARTICTNLLASGVAGTANWPAAISALREEAFRDPIRSRTLALIDSMALTPTGAPIALVAAEHLSTAPEIRFFRQLFSADECAYLLALAEPHYRSSTIRDPHRGDIPHPFRSSDGSAIHWLIEDPAVHALNRRLAAASDTEVECGEPLLILRYKPNQQYRRHYDALPGLDNQRVITALVYLNDDYDGGETEFCQVMTTVKGRTGDVLVFRNADATGRTDVNSEHAGQPVISGIKYLASRWIRARRHQP